MSDTGVVPSVRAPKPSSNYATVGKQIADVDVKQLPYLYAAARREDRQTMLTSAVDEIVSLGVVADLPTSEIQQRRLKELGEMLRSLVLTGTFERQFVCKLATQLGLPRAISLPIAVLEHVVDPLIDALIQVLIVGPPSTRDTAVEGLGGLLKLVPNPAARFPIMSRVEVRRTANEHDEHYAQRQRVSSEYFARFERRRLMVLTLANDVDACSAFSESIHLPIEERLNELLSDSASNAEQITSLYYSHPDLLRVLPAIGRQRSRVTVDGLRLVCAAIRIPEPKATVSNEIAFAFARFQENIYRTIDTGMRRCAWHGAELDDAIGTALRSLHRGIQGAPGISNARIRSTIALMRTAVNLIAVDEAASKTKKALITLIGNLNASGPWINLGIIEGLGRSLHNLLQHGQHDDVTRPVIEWMLRRAQKECALDDLRGIHSHLVAYSCLRRIIAAALDRSSEAVRERMEIAVRSLLSRPRASNVYLLRNPSTDALRSAVHSVDTAPSVTAGIVFETELMERAVSLLGRWSVATAYERLLLVRIMALQLHTLARDQRELERHPMLQTLLSPEPKTLTRAAQDGLARQLLKSLPQEAAEAADAEIQRFIEYRGDSSDDAANELPAYVLATISSTASERIASSIAREVDLHWRYQQAAGHRGDLAHLLYQVALRNPHPAIFDHLLPRIRDHRDRAVVLLFRRNVERLEAAHHWASLRDIDAVIAVQAFRDWAEELAREPHTEHQTLQDLLELLRIFCDLTAPSKNVWVALSRDKTTEFIELLDRLAGAANPRADLVPLRKRLLDLQDEVVHYVALPVGRFAERQGSLSRLIDAVGLIDNDVQAMQSLKWLEHAFLVVLARHWRALFENTRRWFCDEARKMKERADVDRFWICFCDDRSANERIDAFAQLDKPAHSIVTLNSSITFEYIQAQVRAEPPRYPKQREKFEKFFVDWMTAELNVEALRRVLRVRWPLYFRVIHRITTSFWLTCATILFPYAVAVSADMSGKGEYAGLGFFAISGAMLMAALLSFTQLIHIVTGLLRLKTEQRPGYWFRSLLPRLARLTAVPMALIVEFDHSYQFPMEASSWSILLLGTLSFLTTRFFVRRELLGLEEHPAVTVTPDEHRRVWQVVATALAHSFAIAVILSAIFASSHFSSHSSRPPSERIEGSVQVAEGRPSAFWVAVETILERVDNMTPGQQQPKFLGIVPRVVTVDLGVVAQRVKYPLPAKVAEHSIFKFYPTVILVWTALGLFFGVFLEGFMKGERLRGGPAESVAREASDELES